MNQEFNPIEAVPSGVQFLADSKDLKEVDLSMLSNKEIEDAIISEKFDEEDDFLLREELKSRRH